MNGTKQEPVSLPFADDMEKGVLCCLSKKPGQVAAKLGRLELEAFYVPANVTIYETMLEWRNPDKEIDFAWH